MTRKERERLAHRREILLAARGIFAQRGFASATMDEVALAAEFGKATIYSYFESKDELYHAVLEDVLEEFSELIDETMRADVEYAERLTMLVGQTLRAALGAPEGLCLLAREFHAPTRNAELSARVDDALRPIEAVIADEQRAGHLHKRLPASLLARLLLAMVLGAFLEIFQDTKPDSDGARSRAALSDPENKRRIEEAASTVALIFLQGASSQEPLTGNGNRRRRHPAMS